MEEADTVQPVEYDGRGLFRGLAIGLPIALMLWALIGWAILAHAQTTPAPPIPSSNPSPPTWVENQAVHAVAITPSSALFTPTKGIFTAGTSGGAACVLHALLSSTGDTAQTYTNVQPGGLLPLVVIQILSDTTTCTGIIGLY